MNQNTPLTPKDLQPGDLVELTSRLKESTLKMLGGTYESQGDGTTLFRERAIVRWVDPKDDGSVYFGCEPDPAVVPVGYGHATKRLHLEPRPFGLQAAKLLQRGYAHVPGQAK